VPADQESVGLAQSALARAYAAQGRDERAAAAWHEALVARRREVAARPDNPRARRQLLADQEGYAQFLGERARAARAGTQERAVRCVSVREAYAVAQATAATLGTQAGERRASLREGPARWGCEGD